jgi:hypothetical protein
LTLATSPVWIKGYVPSWYKWGAFLGRWLKRPLSKNAAWDSFILGAVLKEWFNITWIFVCNSSILFFSSCSLISKTSISWTICSCTSLGGTGIWIAAIWSLAIELNIAPSFPIISCWLKYKK